ncbi:MAG: adenylate/guanylate cyclase domain-containing protein [Alphaproteobacteria bacterium]|nr:adenylate/guanylate cyclase domain-containing protein [Alphaproteobacteria bacterium]
MASIEATIDWLIAQGLHSDDVRHLHGGISERLIALGVPVRRAYGAMPTRHPQFHAIGWRWTQGDGAELDRYEHRSKESEAFRRSPFRYMLDSGEVRLRRRLIGRNTPDDFPVLEELRAEGATDYYARLIGFTESEAGIGGMIASWVTAADDGFDDAQIATIERVLPAYALACYRIQLKHAAITLLDAYLGADAGRRVLNGDTQRGAVSEVEAALLFTDLRDFTALADRVPGAVLVATLNAYHDAVGAAVERAGGQILKFVGDGLLATFAVAGGGERQACGRALDAALAALAAVDRLNAARRAAGDPTLGLDAALHVGRLMYGNIGSARRLDFTVVGPAVNEVGRIEPLCTALDRPLLMSSRFALSCGRPVVSLGRHVLRGVAEPEELFGLPG